MSKTFQKPIQIPKNQSKPFKNFRILKNLKPQNPPRRFLIILKNLRGDVWGIWILKNLRGGF